MLLYKLKPLLAIVLLIAIVPANAQYSATCADVGSRANSNGQANSCPNVSGTLYALNFVGTAYATVPVTAKTGSLQLKYAGALSTLKPYAITKVWITNPTTTILPVAFGPASLPAISGTDIVVNYCFYNANLPPAGTLSFELTNPETGLVAGICSYDASCSANCTVVANPPTLLPVLLNYFNATEKNNGIQLDWATAQESNNKGFAIERSTNGANFTTIAFIPSLRAGGNSAIATKYTYHDIDVPAVAAVWYRIQQVDLDGHATYSSVKMVMPVKAQPAVSIYSNLQQVTISFATNTAAKKYLLTVYDELGRVAVSSQVTAAGNYTVPGLKTNTRYYVHVTGSNGTEHYSKAVFLNQ